MAFGKEIKRLRGGLSAEYIASILGVGVDKYRKWEERDSNPKDSGEIERIQDYFGMPIADLASLKSFDFVEKPKVDYRDKLIKSLESQILMLEDKVRLLTGEMRHIALTNQAIVQTTQDLIVQQIAKQKKVDPEEFALEVGKVLLVNYEKAKQKGILIGVGS